MDGGLLHDQHNKQQSIGRQKKASSGRMLSVATGGDTSVPQQQLTSSVVYPATATAPDNDQAQFEADKRAVYKHPLFPLLALLFERCELATQSSDPQSSDAFNMDIQAFVQHQERDRKPFLSNEPEIDGLMIKAIQVLRIHLLELEKVQELCKDFCNRYITCLKGKMQSENLLRSDYPGGGGVGGGIVGMESNNNMIGAHGGHSDTGSESNSPVQYSISPQASTPQLDQRHTQQQQQQQQQQVDMAFGLAQYAAQQQATHQQLQAAAALVAPSAIAASCDAANLVVHGSTPLSQIGAGLCSMPASESSGPLSPAPTTPDASGDECDSDFASSRSAGNYRKQKRGVLPKQATSVMRSWLFQHLVHPYPTEDEKRNIAAQTNLTLLQVNNWFINARRRILQPMLDASAPTPDAAGATGENSPNAGGAKKKRTSGQNNNRRFWPQDFANMQPQIDGGLLSSSDEDGDSYSSDGDDASLVIDAHAQMQRQAQENGHGASGDTLQFSNSPEDDK